MDRWINGLVEEWIYGWMGRLMSGWMGWSVDGRVDGLMYVCMIGWMALGMLPRPTGGWVGLIRCVGRKEGWW